MTLEATAEPIPTHDDGSRVVVGEHTLRFLRDGIVAFPAMLGAIAQAKHEVLLEMYWFSADRVGQAFRDALVERANAGVRVAIVFDAIGSWETPWSFFRPLVAAGAEVLQFAPIMPLRERFAFGQLPHRDHRKLLVIDGEVGFAGGINIGEQWAPPDSPELAFRDDAIEIHGPAAQSLRASFFETWARCGHPVPSDAAAQPKTTDPQVRVLTNRFGLRPNRAITSAYFLGMRRSKTSIDIASAYFLPGPLLLHAMRAATRRGVRVRVLVPEHSDVWIATLAMQSLFGRLLTTGVEVYTFTPRVLHSKTAIFDRRFTMIGSHNLDAQSWRYNLECDVAVDSSEFARIVSDAFEADLRESTRLELDSWQARPLSHRASAWVAALFRTFL